MSSIKSKIEEVVSAGICTGCGACVAQLGGKMSFTSRGCVPELPNNIEQDLECDVLQACPGKGIDYMRLYLDFYGKLPQNWILGILDKVWTGYACDPVIRRAGASGGVTTQVLCHLLKSGRIDAAIVVKQGVPKADQASAIIVETEEEIKAAAQSVYIPVSTLDILSKLKSEKSYAITCLPDQAAALRKMQLQGLESANTIKYLIGPYTGTALEPEAIRCLLRSRGVKDNDNIVSLKWRAGEWPGYLEIIMESGKIIRSKKVYYNFLIPFFITQASLQSVDFCNEFCDLAIGDAWSPEYEAMGSGFSVVASRSAEMSMIIKEMEDLGSLMLEKQRPEKASEMHGHMIDFKKRGSFIRNNWRVAIGKKAPDYGLVPNNIPKSRYLVEIIISGLFLVCRNPLARKILEFIPESVIGPLFNKLRLIWKKLSKPTKRKGLAGLHFIAKE